MPDKRLKDYIKPEKVQNNSRIKLISFPSDTGVLRNGGRPGAAKAPELILEQLLKLTPHPAYYQRHSNLLSRVCFCDPIFCGGEVEADQEVLGKIVASTLNDNLIPIIMGGGHETSFGHFLGYVGAGKKVSILNIDAHTDVRPLSNGLAHSGSPFRQAVEHPSGLCDSYNVFGLNPASVSLEHYNFANKHGKTAFDSDVSILTVQNFLVQNEKNKVLATMDMDVVSQGEAPGVSAPNSSGISGALWLNYAYEFGRSPAVKSLDLCEVNPDFDSDNQTVRLAALTIWYFLLGLSLR